ncbi:MAG TPA: PHB depolymerase family esterase [Allosphingosinicella sp.]|jgi:predicted esterase
MRFAARAFAAVIMMAASCMPAEQQPAPRSAAAGELSFRPGTGDPPGPAAAIGEVRLSRPGYLLYVPQSYRSNRPAPLLVMLHGAGGEARHSISLTRAHAERLGFLVLAPKSAGQSWDVISAGGYGPDVRAIDAALAEVAARYRIDPRRIGLAGFSDGASYALALGLINGELFGDVIAFAPCFGMGARTAGRPRLFVVHGIADRVLPIDRCSRRLVPQLRAAGYDVRYEEFPGGHSVPEGLAREAFERFAG